MPDPVSMPAVQDRGKPSSHHGAVARRPHDVEVVGDEQKAHTEPVAESNRQFEDHPLHRNIRGIGWRMPERMPTGDDTTPLHLLAWQWDGSRDNGPIRG
jgi:hypothetical protein